MYVKNSKIILTPFESLLINYTLNHNGLCNIKEFGNHFQLLNGNTVSSKSLVVSINRFRKKVYYQSGYDIFKSRYGFGYVIDS